MSYEERFCLCGGSVRVSSSDSEAVRFITDTFDRFHTGDGHGPATARQAGAARARAEHRGDKRSE